MNDPASLERPGLIRSVLRIARRATEEIAQDDLAGLSAQMGYYFMLALFPMLILLVGVLDLLPLEREVPQMMNRLVQGFPEDVQGLLRRFLTEFAGRRAAAGVFLWTAVALWAASRAISGARRGLNGVLGGARRRNPLMTRLKDVTFTGAAVTLVGAGYVLVFGGKALGALLAKAFGLGHLFPVLWSWLRWPVSIALLTAFLALAYRFLPDRRVRWRAAWAGALPACLGWLALMGSYRVWLRVYDRFDQIYGSLASFFLLMVMLWLFGLVFLLGGEIVAWRTASTEPKENAAPA